MNDLDLLRGPAPQAALTPATRSRIISAFDPPEETHTVTRTASASLGDRWTYDPYRLPSIDARSSATSTARAPHRWVQRSIAAAAMLAVLLGAAARLGRPDRPGTTVEQTTNADTAPDADSTLPRATSTTVPAAPDRTGWKRVEVGVAHEVPLAPTTVDLWTWDPQGSAPDEDPADSEGSGRWRLLHQAVILESAGTPSPTSEGHLRSTVTLFLPPKAAEWISGHEPQELVVVPSDTTPPTPCDPYGPLCPGAPTFVPS